MQETLKMMKSIITGEEVNYNENELILQYQQTKAPNILAYFFVNNYGIIKKTNLIYSILTSQDLASYCLQELDKCLLTMNVSKENKFITYFMKCLKNRLKAENNMLQMQKRKTILNYAELNENVPNFENNIEDINIILDNYKLSKLEQLQCKLLNAGYTCKEIAKILKITPATVSNRNFKIKQKILQNTFNFC